MVKPFIHLISRLLFILEGAFFRTILTTIEENPPIWDERVFSQILLKSKVVHFFPDGFDVIFVNTCFLPNKVCP